MKKVIIIFFGLGQINAQTGWELRPQVESKMHINHASVPFNFGDSINEFFYEPETYSISKKVNVGILVCRKHEKISFETGIFRDYSSFNCRLRLDTEGGKAFTHVSKTNFEYYRLPVKVALLVAGKDFSKTTRKYYSKLWIAFGKDIRLFKLEWLFKSRLRSPELKSAITETVYNNNQVIVNEEIRSWNSRFIVNHIGVQWAVYNNSRKNIFNLGLNYSFRLRANYLTRNMRINANNKTYLFIDYATGNSIYLTLTKEIGLANRSEQRN